MVTDLVLVAFFLVFTIIAWTWLAYESFKYNKIQHLRRINGQR